MRIQEIMQFISSLRKTKKRLITNYYLTLQGSEEDFESWTSENSIVFCAQENKVYRCYFATTDMNELNTLLQKMPSGTVLDYITKEKTRDFRWVDAGFKLYRTLIRYTNPNWSDEDRPKSKRALFLEQFYDETIGEFATPADAEELYELLYKIFDYRVSRLPSMEQLIEMIEKKWVLLYREQGKITAFLMYQIEGRKYYGYQIYNKGTADITYNLERKATKYAQSAYQIKVPTGGLRLTIWVPMTDVKAEALMEHTTIYLLSPENISLIKQGELYKNNGGNQNDLSRKIRSVRRYDGIRRKHLIW